MAAIQSTNDANKTAAQNEPDETANIPDTYLENLNDDCLITLFGMLNEVDLVRMCEYNDRFCSIVKNHVIPKKIINFSKLSDVVDIELVFLRFGTNLRKIKIKGRDIQHTTPDLTEFDEFLSLVQTYCIADNIVNLDIDFYIKFSQHTERLLTQAIPFFRNVLNLRIDFGGTKHDFIRFLKMFPNGNVRSIELGEGDPAAIFNWLRTFTPGKLERIHLSGTYKHNPPFGNTSDADAFFESQPNIKTLYCGDRLAMYLESIAKHSSNVENVSKTQIFKVGDENFHTVTFRSLKADLPKLNKLKSMQINAVARNGSDLYRILDCFPENNVLNSLSVNFDPHYFIGGWIRLLNLKNTSFTNLTQLHLSALCSQYQQNVFDEFLRVGLPAMTNVKKLIINSSCDSSALLQIVKMMKHLCILEVSVHLSKQLYLQLVEARKEMWKHQDQSQHRPITIAVWYCNNHRTEIGDAFDGNVVNIINKC